MAQLTDTLVSGDERVTGMIYGTQAGNYATCSSGASAVKTVTIPGFVLTTGVHVRIKFTNTNTLAVASLTLNVSETGAKAIKVKGNNLAAAGDLAANGVYEFVYDGTNWELTGAVPTSHAHGNIANGGTLTDTAAAAAGNDYVVIRDADNAKIQTSTIKGTDVADAVSKKHSHTSITVTKTATQYDGSHTLKLPDSDPYTSARTPTSHADANGAYGKATTANFGHVQLATGDMNGAANVDGVAVSKNHTHSQYLPKSGGTMSGAITLPNNKYWSNNEKGIDANNSDIVNANSIYFKDRSTTSDEGLHFACSDATNPNYDSLWIDNGKICFYPNHAVAANVPSSSAQIVPRLPNSVSDNQVVLTNGTTGALKTSAASSLSVGTAADYNTSSGTIKTMFDELTIRATSSSSIYGFMFKKPLDGGSWYDGYGFSMMTFYGGSGHLYEIGVRLAEPTSSNPFPSGSRLAITVMGNDELYVLGFNSHVWYKIVDNELQIIFLTPFTSTTYTTRIHMPGIVTRDKALTTSNSTILTASVWASATESVLVAAGWTHKDSSEVVFRRTLLSEGTTLPISKGGTAKTTRKAATNNLFSDIASDTSNVTGDTQMVFKYASPSDTNGIFYYRTASYLWSWLQTQLGYNSSSNKYGINISGTAAAADTAASAGYATAFNIASETTGNVVDTTLYKIPVLDDNAAGRWTGKPSTSTGTQQRLLYNPSNNTINANITGSANSALTADTADRATEADTVDGVHMHIGYSAAESTVCFF